MTDFKVARRFFGARFFDGEKEREREREMEMVREREKRRPELPTIKFNCVVASDVEILLFGIGERWFERWRVYIFVTRLQL